MTIRDRAAWALCSLIALALLLAPAIWNRFPLVEYDTGGYLARWWEGYLVPSRSTVYGLFLAAGWPLDFWPVVAIQAALTVWILALALRAFGFGGRPRLLLAVTAALALLTTLPFLAGILLTDIFAGTALLALHILVFRNGTLARAERAALILFTAFCAATHSATFAVLLGLLIAGGCAWIFWRDLVPLAGLARGLGALALGAVMLLGANFGLSGRLAWTPGGYGIVFARMLQDGVIKRYLDDHCPDSTLKLCPYRDKLPATADQFLWGESFFDDLGRFDGLGDEMRRIVLESLIAYPKMQIETALADAAEQLVAVASGEGVGTDVYHSYGMMEMYTPAVLPALWAARQQKGELDFAAINHLHVPVALISMVLLPVIVIVALRRRGPADIGLLAGTVGLALLGNAVVCGVLSNPHDRYGARLAWTATFVVVLIVLRLARPHPERAPGRNTHGVRA
jgi:hypothetical protein